MAESNSTWILFGATGFTGRQAVLRAGAPRGDAAAALGGRRPPARQAGKVVAERCRRRREQPGVVVADANDLAAVASGWRRRLGAAQLAGPYALTGEAVVQACIANGTHHLDLTGETFWVQQLIARHHRAAKRRR